MNRPWISVAAFCLAATACGPASRQPADVAPLPAPVVERRQPVDRPEPVAHARAETAFTAVDIDAREAPLRSDRYRSWGTYPYLTYDGPRHVPLRPRREASVSFWSGDLLVTGGLETVLVRRYVRRRLPRITHCYEKALVDDLTLRGLVKAELAIAADGTVWASAASGVDDRVASCIAGELRSTVFPAPDDDAMVDVAMTFHLVY